LITPHRAVQCETDKSTVNRDAEHAVECRLNTSYTFMLTSKDFHSS